MREHYRGLYRSMIVDLLGDPFAVIRNGELRRDFGQLDISQLRVWLLYRACISIGHFAIVAQFEDVIGPGCNSSEIDPNFRCAGRFIRGNGYRSRPMIFDREFCGE